MTTHAGHTAHLTETASAMRATLDDPIAQAAAALLDAVARTLATADPATLFDYAPTAGAALHLADTYRQWLGA